MVITARSLRFWIGRAFLGKILMNVRICSSEAVIGVRSTYPLMPSDGNNDAELKFGPLRP